MSSPLDTFAAFVESTGPVFPVAGRTRPPTYAAPVHYAAPDAAPKAERWRCVYCEARVLPAREKCPNCGAPRMT